MSNLILIVEDREDDSFLLEQSLRNLGVANPLVKLSSGEEALAYLVGEGRFGNRRQYPLPKVLFLDLKMIGKSGFDVLEWLQTHPLPAKCLFFVISDLQSATDMARAYQ